MGFLSDTEIESRLNSPDNLMNRLTVHEIKRGGSPSIPLEIKKVVAILGNEGEKVKGLAKTLNIGERNSYRYRDGVTNSGEVKEELKEVVENTKSELERNRSSAESLAVEALLASMHLLPKALASTTKAKDISSVAKDMAMVSNMMGNKNDPDGKGNHAMHIHLYAPKMKETSDYEVIDVNVE